jgi:hypothetical protein
MLTDTPALAPAEKASDAAANVKATINPGASRANVKFRRLVQPPIANPRSNDAMLAESNGRRFPRIPSHSP